MQQQPMTQLPLIGPISIGPQPIPTNITVATWKPPAGADLVVMQFATPLGVSFFFLDHGAAAEVIRMLQSATGSGIVLARPVPLVPPRPKG